MPEMTAERLKLLGITPEKWKTLQENHTDMERFAPRSAELIARMVREGMTRGDFDLDECIKAGSNMLREEAPKDA